MLKYIGLSLLGALILYQLLQPRRGCYKDGVPTIAEVSYGKFKEYIPQTGSVDFDSISGIQAVRVPIDELYQDRICEGLKATTTFQNKDYQLQITDVNPSIKDGPFCVMMSFIDPVVPLIQNRQALRLRIQLSEESDQILLPVGGYYRDTEGKWIFVVSHNRAMRRDIKLGRKMGSEYFEVLDGLKPGDRVVTTTYESLNSFGFDGKDSVELSYFEPSYSMPNDLKRFRQDMHSLYNSL